jgi:hypothetical protein
MVKTVRPTRNMAALLGFLVKGEVDAIFKQQPFELVERNAEPLQLWRRSSDAIRNLSPTPTSPKIELLDPSQHSVVKSVMARRTFQKYYEAVADYQFALVPIDALLAPQWFADVDYIDELSAQIDPDASLDQQVRLAMAEGTITEPIVSGPQIIFTSPRRDLHADQIPTIRETDPGEFEITIHATSRPNYVSAAAVGNRLLLTNGVHKVCAFAKAGFVRVPCLLRQINRIEESGLQVNQTSLFRPELINSLRPAQVADFLKDQVSVQVTLRSMYQVLRIGIGIETLTVPAISPPIETYMSLLAKESQETAPSASSAVA